MVTKWSDLFEVYPAAAVYPMMSDEELEELASDIARNGLQQPIVLLENNEKFDRKYEVAGSWNPDRSHYLVLDGRNRLAALDRTSVEVPADWRLGAAGLWPTFGTVESEVFRVVKLYDWPRRDETQRRLAVNDIAGFIIGANVRRRHLRLSKADQARLIMQTVEASETFAKTARVSEIGVSTTPRKRAWCEQCESYAEKLPSPEPEADDDDFVCPKGHDLYEIECSCTEPDLSDPDHIDGFCMGCCKMVSYERLVAWQLTGTAAAGARGPAPDPFKAKVVEEAAKAGISKRTVERVLAEREDRPKAPRHLKAVPSVTDVPDIKSVSAKLSSAATLLAQLEADLRRRSDRGESHVQIARALREESFDSGREMPTTVFSVLSEMSKRPTRRGAS